ncbi:putative receptor protein kinase ZmPK1 [Hordeum vulgare]|nr:putative receptor protein kinase ZmPK1 [Hordeum vulgare]
MDGCDDIPLIPSYARAPSAATADPSPKSFASAGAPSTKGLACGLFMASWLTSAGGPTQASAMKPRAPLSKLPNVTVAKAGKVSGKKNKEADGSSRRLKKKLRGHATVAAAIEAPSRSLVAPSADAHSVFDKMFTSFNDETYISTMGVSSNNSHWSQTNEVHLDDHEYEVAEDCKGIDDAPKGRVSNYTMDEDILLCNTWLKVFRDAIVGGDQSRDAY